MSQPKNKRDSSKINNTSGSFLKQPSYRKGKNMDNNYKRPYKDFHYYSAKYNFQPRWGPYRRRPPHQKYNNANVPERPPSPYSGTEEYRLRKIKETSNFIQQRLMSPEEDVVIEKPKTPPVDENNVQTSSRNDKTGSEKNLVKSSSKKTVCYNVEEIHDKIVTHITKLSHGKKINLISANSSGYDVAIQQIQKQKRLELSKVLRDMCSKQNVENGEVINAIIPDIGIKIEDLPLEIIQELSSTLDLNFEEAASFHQTNGTVSVKSEICDEDDDVVCLEPVKQEVFEIRDEEMEEFEIKHESVDLKTETIDERETCPTVIINQSYSDIYVKAEDTPTEVASSTTSDLQTECRFNTVATQTYSYLYNPLSKVTNLDQAVKVMLEIDNEIKRLTELRQAVFMKVQAKEKKKVAKQTITSGKNKKKKANRMKNVIAKAPDESNDRSNETENSSNNCENMEESTEAGDNCNKALDFGVTSEKILVIKVRE